MNKIKNITLRRKITTALVAFVMVAAVPVSVLQADTFDDQIRILQAENNKFQEEASRLAQEADTLQNKLAVIGAQKQSIQVQIDLSQKELDKLTAQIVETEDQITKQKDLLGGILAKLYVESKTTTIEMLASSDSIGDYMDKQTYQSSIRNKLNGSIKKIKQLQTELAAAKVKTESVIADQKSKREALAAQEAEQAAILAETQGQEANYQRLVSSNNGRMSQLRAAQAAQLAATRRHAAARGGAVVAGDPGKGGYPAYLANAPLDSIVDDWGMYNRECVSYAAWKVYQKNGYMQHGGGQGHAYQWPSTYGNVSQGSTPKVGSVVVWSQNQIGGGYGHVAWVEAVNADGSIYVSQYNYGCAGCYSEMSISAGEASRLTYIYF